MPDLLLRPRRVLVPLLNLGVAPQLVNFAAALITGPETDPPPSARIIVAGVVEIASGQPFSEGRAMARSYRAMFGFLPASAGPHPPAAADGQASTPDSGPMVPVDRIVKVAHSVAHGVREAVIEENADLLLLHWKGYATDRRRAAFGEITDALLDDPPCNCLLFRPGRWGEVDRILIAVRGGPSAELALGAGAVLAARTRAVITLLHGVPPANLLDRPAAPAVGAAVGKQPPEARAAVAQAVDRLRGDEPYIEIVRRAAAIADRLRLSIAPLMTTSGDVSGVIAAEAAGHDLVVLGAPARHKGAAGELNEVVSRLAAEKDKPLLLARAARELDLAEYQRRARPLSGPGDLAVEHWFVENTYHGDEAADLDAWLALKSSRGAHLSVVLPTHNDAHRIHSLLIGLRKALQEHAPIADEILVVDAASTDNTAQIAAEMGFPVVRASGGREVIPPPEPQTLLRQALVVARGNVVVWLDPKAGRIHPSLVPALTPPLMSDPTVALVKPFWSLQAGAEAQQDADGEQEARARFSPLRPADLLAMRMDELADLPMHAWLRAFFPALGGVVDPTAPAFAARASLLKELTPALEEQQERLALAGPAIHRSAAGLAFYAGLLLLTAARHGPRSIAQVELPRRRSSRQSHRHAPPDLRQLRQIAELLQLFALHKDEVADPETLEKIRRRIAAATK